MSTTTLNRPETTTSRPLALMDRCDACSGYRDGVTTAPQAFARATKDGKEILFCGHHFRKHEAALLASGWILDDQTDRINEKPSTSANAI